MGAHAPVNAARFDWAPFKGDEARSGGAPQDTLLARIAAIEAHAALRRERQSWTRSGVPGAGSDQSLSAEIAAIRALARQHGLHAATAVTHALDAALARGERGPLIHGWLRLLADAIGCGRHDAAACETFSAACCVRLSG